MRRAIAATCLLAGCAGTAARTLTEVEHQDSPAPLGPTFAVTSKDPRPITFTRKGAGGAEVRYVFRREASPTDRALHAVAIDRRYAYAVGDGGVAVRRTANGAWQTEPTGTDAALRGVVVASWEGQAFASYPADPHAVPLYAVGDRGTIVRRDTSGAWAVQPSPTQVDLHAIAATAAEAIAVGDRGTILWLHGGAWRTVVSHTDAALRSIALSEYAAVIVGDGGAIVECTFPADHLACVPRPSPTTAGLTLIAERTVRWDSGTITGFTIHELEAFGADASRLTRAAWYPIELAAGRTAPFAVRGYAGQHWSWDVAEPEDVAVGAAGQLALVDPYRAWIPERAKAAAPDVVGALAARDPAEPGAFDLQSLPEAVDLDAAAFEGLDGFVVGDRGTILQLTVEGAHIPVAVLL